MPASSSMDLYLLKVFRGSFWPLGSLFPAPFFLGLFVFLELGQDAAVFNDSAAFTHAPATFTFPARALRREAEVPHLAPSVGARGSELDPDPAPRVKVWCLGAELGPAPGDPELLSACNADSHSARCWMKLAPTSRRKPGYRSIPIRDRQKHK